MGRAPGAGIQCRCPEGAGQWARLRVRAVLAEERAVGGPGPKVILESCAGVWDPPGSGGRGQDPRAAGGPRVPGYTRLRDLTRRPAVCAVRVAGTRRLQQLQQPLLVALAVTHGRPRRAQGSARPPLGPRPPMASSLARRWSGKQPQLRQPSPRRQPRPLWAFRPAHYGLSAPPPARPVCPPSCADRVPL